MTLNKLRYDVADYRKKRVIIDTDAACEGDDPFAIVHALISKMLVVKGITAEHFVAEGSMEASYQVCRTIVDVLDCDVPVLRGQTGPIKDNRDEALSEASEFIIQEAMRDDPMELYVLCIGAITNVAKAILARPEIVQHMKIVWIGCCPFDGAEAVYEFNSANDVEAANVVLQCGGDVRVIPNTVYGTMHIGFAEIQRRIAGCGEIGRFLYENLIAFYESENAGWSAGESWSLGDSPAVGVCLEPNCGSRIQIQAPFIRDDFTYEKKNDAKTVTMYTNINSRFILEDLICKLEILFENA